MSKAFRVILFFVLTSTGLLNAKGIQVGGTNPSFKTREKSAKTVPSEMNYQGWLGYGSDTTAVNSQLDMVFRIYSAGTGGTKLWEESQNNVTVSKGIFNVILGSVTPIPVNIFTGANLWLETQVGTEILLPRKKLTSVGYSIKSQKSDTASVADTANYVSGPNVDGEVTNANKSDTTGYVAGSNVNGEVANANRSDTASYALSANVTYVDSARVATTSYKWNNNSWGVDYPKADKSDTALYIAGANVNGKVASAGIADTVLKKVTNSVNSDTANYAKSVNINYVDSARIATNSYKWNGNNWGVDYPKSDKSDTALYIAGANVNGEVANANKADTAGYVAGASPSGTAGGDLSGSYPSPTVVKIQGNPVGSTTPSANQVLKWNGSSWAPDNINSVDSARVSANSWNSYALQGKDTTFKWPNGRKADTAGIAGNVTGVVAIANGGTGLSSAGGTANRVLLTTDGSTWAAGQVNLGTSQISGTLPITNGGTGATSAADARTNLGLGTLATLDAVSGGTGGTITDATISLADIAQNGAANNQIMKWNGSAWVVADDSVGSNYWAISGNKLYPSGDYGLSMRSGNTMYGTNDSTHVNFGIANVTGTSGQNYKYCAVAGGYNNTASDFAATVGGGGNNTASGSVATVGGGNTNTASGQSATVSGGQYNKARGQSSVVSGGGSAAPSDSNSAIGDYSAIGGGRHNLAGGNSAVVGGGWNNNAGNQYSTVGGGWNNTANGDRATIAGGYANTSGGERAAVGGGWSNASGGYAATISGGQQNTANSNYATVGGGASNIAGQQHATVAGGYQNTASGQASTVSGGYVNTSSNTCAAVSGGSLNVASGQYSTVGAGEYNKARGQWSVVCGGGNGSAADSNSANGDYSAIGGGYHNVASGNSAVISGGRNNTAGTWYSVVGGGQQNTASGQYAIVGGGEANSATSHRATVGGGSIDTAVAMYGGVASGWHNIAGDAAEDTAAFIGGGKNNKATAMFATVGGGNENTAAGDASVIPGGYRDTLTANADTSLAFGSNVYVDKASRVAFFDGTSSGGLLINCDHHDITTASDTFPLRVGTDGSNGNGAYLTKGGVWTDVSSRDKKENFERLDGENVLNKVSELNVSKWKYKNTNEYHIGPVAEEFYKAFGVSEEKHLSSLDASGVALRAIQELTAKVEAQEKEIGLLKEKLAEMQK